MSVFNLILVSHTWSQVTYNIIVNCILDKSSTEHWYDEKMKSGEDGGCSKRLIIFFIN